MGDASGGMLVGVGVTEAAGSTRGGDVEVGVGTTGSAVGDCAGCVAGTSVAIDVGEDEATRVAVGRAGTTRVRAGISSSPRPVGLHPVRVVPMTATTMRAAVIQRRTSAVGFTCQPFSRLRVP